MAQNPGTNKQIPDHAIMDLFGKQSYLANKYAYAVSNTPGVTTEVPLILLSNPIVTTKAFPSGFTGLFVPQIRLSCLTASQTAIIRVYMNPTVTSAGTVETPVQLRPASPNTSIAALSLSPSVSSNGTIFDISSASLGLSAMLDTMAVLDPDESLLITVQASSSGTAVGVALPWWEI